MKSCDSGLSGRAAARSADKCARQSVVAGAEGRLDQRQVDHVALRMAAAEAVGDAADRPQQPSTVSA